jgi:hypothetical protein
MKSFLETGRMPRDAADPTDDDWVHRPPADSQPSDPPTSSTSEERRPAPADSGLH